jgi:hypothetical protein
MNRVFTYENILYNLFSLIDQWVHKKIPVHTFKLNIIIQKKNFIYIYIYITQIVTINLRNIMKFFLKIKKTDKFQVHFTYELLFLLKNILK